MSMEIKAIPLSDIKVIGTPNLVINTCSKNSITTSVVALFARIASDHLMK